jgi:hypothetical protein
MSKAALFRGCTKWVLILGNAAELLNNLLGLQDRGWWLAYLRRCLMIAAITEAALQPSAVDQRRNGWATAVVAT